MATTTDEQVADAIGCEPIPPLENGDRLTRAEFERRYDAMPHLKKAELIGGVVYMQAAVRVQHGDPHSMIVWWLRSYKLQTPGVQTCDNTTIRLDDDNVPQPDAMLRILPEHGGQSKTSPEGYVEGPPELAVEIAASTASYDLHDKLNAYQRNGVREYIVWRVQDKQVDWFVLQNDKYERLDPGKEGILKSDIFPGLWLDVKSLLAGDDSTVIGVLREGLATGEHAAFVAQMGG